MKLAPDTLSGSDRLLYWIGAAGLLALAIYVMFGAAPAIQGRVGAAAEAALAADGQAGLRVRAGGQRVELLGAVESDAARLSAIEAARSALGAGGLFNGGVTKVIARNVDVAPLISPYTWSAVKTGPQVELSGHAPNRQARALIENSARDLFGDNVVSRMQLASGAPEGVDLGAATNAALAALRQLDRGSADLIDGRLRVSGFAPTDMAASTARTLVAGAEGGVTATADIHGAPDWTATLKDGRLSFAGRIGSEAARDTLARSGQLSAPDAFTDNSQLGGADGWVEHVRALLPNFMNFDEGEIAVFGDLIRVSGAAPGSAIGYMREDMARLQNRYSVLFDVREDAPDIAEIADIDLSSTGPAQQENCQIAFQNVMDKNEILFGVGDASINRESGRTLDKLVEIARRCAGLRIEVQGHTDDTGTRAKNLRLSRARADAVMTYLVERGVPAGQLSAEGYGPDQPVASNRTADGRARNRRIQFTVSSVEQVQ
ncbi:MAG: OmpA family protein [Hyphomonadaceae bacterium]